MDPVEHDALRVSEERFRLAFDEAPIGMAIVELDGRFNRVNRALCTLVGYAPEELERLTLQTLVHPDDPPRDASLVDRLLAGEIPSYQREKRYVRKDGAVVHVRVHVTVLRDSRGRPHHVLGQIEDVTEARRNAESLALSEEQLRALIDLAPDGIGVTDAEGRYTLVNAAFCRMLAGTCEQILGKTVSDFIAAEQTADLAEMRRALDTPGTVRVQEWSLRRFDGTLLPVEVSVAGLPDGRRQGFVRDISERKRHERLQQEWISVVAHDLQQPVAAIQIYAGLLDRVARRDPEGHAPVAKIVEIAGVLHRMIADLLDLARADVGQLPLWRRPVDLTRLARTAVERVALMAVERPIHVVVSGEIPALLLDPDRIVQVLENLLSNAVKYGAPATPITLTVERLPGEVTVAVTNEGEGIAPEELPRLFQRFQRGGAAHSGVKGAGLGLHIARELCQAHGGRLGAESVPGGRTTFRFTLPLEAEGQARD
jgi:PAS domain S-box-containing protein